MPSTEDTEATRIIVVESEQGSIGLVVDSVKEVITIQRDEMEDAPILVAAGKTDFVLGLAKQGDTLITLLDLDKALAA
jgi:purine-binding chemotaxis protein CheW